MVVVRYVLPAILLLTGVVMIIIDPSVLGLYGLATAIGAALALLLLNLLYRAGVQGDRERDREEAARAYYSEHGRWPDERR
jgi:hypothetical protein